MNKNIVGHRDFFISYNNNDESVAKWIGGTLEENGYSVYIQAWDITAGDDFIQRMNVFLENSTGYIAIISSHFWNSEYCNHEFRTAFNEKLKNNIKKVIPVRVEDVSIPCLYATTIYIDLFGMEEAEAERHLLNAVSSKNPRKKGTFPYATLNSKAVSGNKYEIEKPPFPLSSNTAQNNKAQFQQILFNTNIYGNNSNGK
jgi:hypothetical protein